MIYYIIHNPYTTRFRVDGKWIVVREKEGDPIPENWQAHTNFAQKRTFKLAKRMARYLGSGTTISRIKDEKTMAEWYYE